MWPEMQRSALVMVDSLVIADLRPPYVASAVNHAGREFDQFTGSCPTKALQFDQIADQWPNHLLDRLDSNIVYSSSRSVVVCFSSALQQWRDGLQCLKR